MPRKTSLRTRQRWQWLWMVVALLALGGLFGLNLLSEFHDTETAEKERLRLQVQVVARNLKSQMESTDRGLRRLIADLPRWRTGDGYRPGARLRLQSLQETMQGVRSISIVGPDGIILESSLARLQGEDASIRDFFQEARRAPDASRLILTAPFRTVLGVYTMNLVRTIPAADGGFSGLVSATLDPGYFSTLLDSVRYGEDMRTSLSHGVGRLFLVQPTEESWSGRDLNDPEGWFARHLKAGGEESVFSDVLDLTGVSRMGVLRTVRLESFAREDFLVVGASRDRIRVFTSWRRNAIEHLLTYLGFVLLTTLSLAYWHHWERRWAREREAAQRELEFSHQRYERMSRTVPCALYEWSEGEGSDGRFHFASPRFADLLEVQPEDVLADAGRVWRLIDPGEAGRVRDEMDAAVLMGDAFRLEARMNLPSGRSRWIEIAARPIVLPDGVSYWQGYLLDITERKAAEQELRHLATTDTLTGVANRGSFVERFRLELDRVRRFRMPAAFLMLDIDHFKQVNDRFGHAVGDEVLRHLSQVSVSSLRRVDLYGRIGGEEFGILLPGTDLAGAQDFAERLRQSVQDTPAVTAGGPVSFTISIGVTELIAADPDIDTVMARADVALYAAKNRGRNRVVVHAPDDAADGTEAG